MDICLPELAPTEDERTGTTAQKLLASAWIVIYSTSDAKREESERATHELCAALAMRTTEEARLN